MLIAIIVASLALFLCLWKLLSLVAGGKNNVNIRLRHYAAANSSQDELSVTERQNSATDELDYLAPLLRLSKYFANWPRVEFFEQTMRMAGIPLRGTEFILISLSSAGIVFILFAILMLNILQAFIVTVCWLLAIWFYVLRQIKRRGLMFNEQLCEAIGMMANAMKSGFSFLQTLDIIAKEMKPPISQEFARTLREVQLGISMEDALKNLVARVQSKDLELVITAVLIQRQVGGNMSKVLDNIGRTINERVKIQSEIRTLTAEGKLSGYVVAAMPFLMSLLFLLVDPKYFDDFLTHPLGLLAIGVGLVMQLIGIFVIQKIVDIKL